MSLVIAPVSYKRLLTTISQHFQIDSLQNITPKQEEKMKDIQYPIAVDLDNYLLDHSSYDFSSSKTNFLDLLDDDTLLQLAYEFGLDKKSELPELQDIEVAINDFQNNFDAPSSVPLADADKLVQR